MAGAGFLDAAALHEFLDPVAEIRGGDAGAVAAGHLRLQIASPQQQKIEPQMDVNGRR
jgi:hypothetical protein